MVMVKLWQQLVELYGNKAQIKYGSPGGEVFESWSNKLRYLKPADIIRGLDACLVREEEWPPELQEFMRLCIATKPSACHQPYAGLKRLTAQKATRETADLHRAKLKELLGKGNANA